MYTASILITDITPLTPPPSVSSRLRQCTYSNPVNAPELGEAPVVWIVPATETAPQRISVRFPKIYNGEVALTFQLADQSEYLLLGVMGDRFDGQSGSQQSIDLKEVYVRHGESATIVTIFIPSLSNPPEPKSYNFFHACRA